MFRCVITALEQYFKCCLQPAKPSLVLATLADITRSKSELIAENAFLRQQLTVLQRQTKRPILKARDGSILVLLASRLRTWHQALLIVKLDTLLVGIAKASACSGGTSPKQKHGGLAFLKQ